MLEQIIDKQCLKKVEPQRMEIGSFWTFTENDNLFGIGNQDVHNSGSSMIRDTPNFKLAIIQFLNSHIALNKSDEYKNKTVEDIYDDQKIILERFKNEPQFRHEVLDNIFISDTLVFRSDIPARFFVTALLLYIMKKYNYFNSKYADHDLTKNAIKRFYFDADEMFDSIYNVLYSDEKIEYLTDVCFGRYYFLEVHFTHRNSKNQIRNVPQQIISEFFACINNEEDDEEEKKYQRTISYAKPYNSEELEEANNKEPVKTNNNPKSHRYQTDARKAKTVLKLSKYLCSYGQIMGVEHITFIAKDGNPYMEGHHLIPMKAQKDFLPKSLDVSYNIVSLCPICHAQVHKGNIEEKEKILKKLYDKNIEKLKENGINITFEELINKYYKG